MTPLVTVVVPVKNMEGYIREAVSSVLAQTYPHLEIIVIDDGCTDTSIPIVESLGDARIKVIRGPQQGLGAALNAAIAVATGKYYTNCDADDRFPPDRIAWQVAYLEDHPDFVAACGGYVAINPKGDVVNELPTGPEAAEITDELRSGTTRTHHATFMVRMDLVKALGGMRSYFVTGLDIDFQFRLGERGRVWYDPRTCYYYRIHDSSMTHTETNERNKFFQRKAREFQQQRLSGQADDLERGVAESPPTPSSGQARPASEQLQGFLTAASWRAFNAGNRGEAIQLGIKGALMHPLTIAGWRNLAVLCAKSVMGAGKK